MEAMRHTEHYTYADYAEWDDGQRYELIDGKPYVLSTPSSWHQLYSGRLFVQLYNMLEGKTCQVYAAPFDVRLNARGDGDDTVVQPDISVICDRSKIDDKGCNGAPDFIIEITSPSNRGHDRIVKLNRYLQAGVREYWVVDPDDQSISAHILRDGQYIIHAYQAPADVPVHILEDAVIELSKVFAE